MTYDEFLSWRMFIKKEIEDERDIRGLTLWYLAHLSYYIYDLKFILGGRNPHSPKDFWIELNKENYSYDKPNVIHDENITQDEIHNIKMETEKAWVAAMLGLDYYQIKQKHGLKK